MVNIKYLMLLQAPFEFSPQVPEFLTYSSDQCDKLEYSTKSENVTGSIKDFKILSPGI